MQQNASSGGNDDPGKGTRAVNPSSALFLVLADPTRLARASRMVSILEGFNLAIDAVCLPPTEGNNFRSVIPISSELVGVREKRWRLISRKAAYAFSVHQPLRCAFRRAIDYRYGLVGLARQLALKQPSLIVTEDIELLPLALDIKALTGAKVLIDVRDFKWDTRQISLGVAHRDHWIYQRRLFSTYLAHADAIVAVSEGQRKLMEQVLRVHPIVIRSTPNYCRLDPTPPSRDVIKLIYHGKADRERQLELIIEAAGFIGEHVILDLVISHSQSGYLDELKALAQRFDNVRFVPPVHGDEIIGFANRYDLGLIVYPPSNSNIASALPNKFFELLQSRLGILVGPGGDMADIVDTYGFGIVTNGYQVEDVVAAIRSVTHTGIIEMKQRAQIAAEELNFEAEGKKLSSLVGSLLSTE